MELDRKENGAKESNGFSHCFWATEKSKSSKEKAGAQTGFKKWIGGDKKHIGLPKDKEVEKKWNGMKPRNGDCNEREIFIWILLEGKKLLK